MVPHITASPRTCAGATKPSRRHLARKELECQASCSTTAYAAAAAAKAVKLPWRSCGSSSFITFRITPPARNGSRAPGAYLERRQKEGKSRREAIRALKRHLARIVYRLLRAGRGDPPERIKVRGGEVRCPVLA